MASGSGPLGSYTPVPGSCAPGRRSAISRSVGPRPSGPNRAKHSPQMYHEPRWPSTLTRPKKQQLCREHLWLYAGVGFYRATFFSHHPPNDPYLDYHLTTTRPRAPTCTCTRPPVQAEHQTASHCGREAPTSARSVDHFCRPCLANAAAIGHSHFIACPLHPGPYHVTRGLHARTDHRRLDHGSDRSP